MCTLCLTHLTAKVPICQWQMVCKLDCWGLFLWTWELIPISVGIRAEQTWKWCFTIQCKVQNRKKASRKYVAEHKSLVKADTYLNRVRTTLGPIGSPLPDTKVPCSTVTLSRFWTSCLHLKWIRLSAKNLDDNQSSSFSIGSVDNLLLIQPPTTYQHKKTSLACLE